MFLVADSGATKTDWRFVDENQTIHSFSSAGLNPLFWTSKEMIDEINKKCPKEIKSKVKRQKAKVFFYGASCSSKERIKIVHTALSRSLGIQKSKTEIHHDILASARAVCGNKEGIAAILGTGSNSCHYDGNKITKIIGGLTYMLGDEGSGAHIGLTFLKAFLNNELPQNIHATFFNEYRLTRDKIFNSVYNKKYPNRFLASFTKFIGECIEEPFLHELVRNCFKDFFKKTICRYENHRQIPVGFVGSVAFHFQNILTEVAKEKNVRLEKIIESPIEDLVKYHLKEKIK